MIAWNPNPDGTSALETLNKAIEKYGIKRDSDGHLIYPPSPDLVTLYWAGFDYSKDDYSNSLIYGADRNVKLSVGIAPPPGQNGDFKGVGLPSNTMTYSNNGTCSPGTTGADYFTKCFNRISYIPEHNFYMNTYSRDVSYRYPWNSFQDVETFKPPQMSYRVPCTEGDKSCDSCGDGIQSCFEDCKTPNGKTYRCVKDDSKTSTGIKCYKDGGKKYRCQQTVFDWNRNGNWSGALMNKFFTNANEKSAKFVKIMMYSSLYDGNPPCLLTDKKSGECPGYIDGTNTQPAWWAGGFPLALSGMADYAMGGDNRNLFIIEGQTMIELLHPSPVLDMLASVNMVNKKKKVNSNVFFKLFNVEKEGAQCALRCNTDNKSCNNNPTDPNNTCCNRDHTKMYWSEFDILISSGHPYNGSYLDWSGINEDCLIENAPSLVDYFNNIFNVYWKSSTKFSDCPSWNTSTVYNNMTAPDNTKLGCTAYSNEDLSGYCIPKTNTCSSSTDVCTSICK